MKTIGLTGIFGSGKSTVSGFLGELGATIIDTDNIVRQLYQPEADGFRRVVDLFGPDVLDVNGYLDRRKIADIIFEDKIARAKLNAAIHPLVIQQIKALLAEYRRRQIPIVVAEVPLLIEANLASMVDEIWVTTAPREVIFQRLNRKSGLSCSAILARIHAQLPVREQIRYATRVISTDTSLRHLRSKVQRLWQKINTPTTAQNSWRPPR